MKALVFITGIILLSQGLIAQVTLKGRVIDPSGSPLEAANILFFKTKGGKLFGFTTSGKSGEFSKTLSNIDSTVILIKVHHLSYEAYEEIISDFSKEIVVVMQGKNHLLDEIIVKNKKVEQRGDTLNFDFAQYRDENDKNIEDVLKKIPNITISESGAIKYKDLPISKFYINKLDLLEGRYGIATRNLDMNAVQDVQIFENHQHIRVLQPINSPDNAAINLQLKNKITFSTSGKAGIGYEPARYLASVNSFGFQGRQQFNINAFGNNNGLNQRSDAQNHYIGSYLIQQISSHQNDLRVTQALPPDTEQRYYLENTEFGAGINFLRKVSRYTELKLQTLAHSDRIRTEGINELSFFTGNQRVFFDQDLKNVRRLTDFDHKMIIEWNGKKVYLRFDGNLKWNNEATLATNRINNANITEDLSHIAIESKSYLDLYFAVRKKALQIRTEFNINSLTDTFDILPSIFKNSDGFRSFYQTRQNLGRSIQDIHSHTSFLGKSNFLTYGISPGIILRNERLITNLFGKISSGDVFTSQGEGYKNDVHLSRIEFYEKSYLKYRREALNLSFNLPIKFLAIGQYNENMLFRGLIAKPQFNISYTNHIKRSFGLNYDFSNDLYSDRMPYEGLILSSYQNLRANPLVFQRLFRHTTGLSYSFNDIMTNMRFNSGIQFSMSRSNLITNQSIEANGVVSTISEGKNFRENLTMYSFLKRPLLTSKILFEGNLNYTIGSGNFVVNNKEQKSINRSLILKTNFSTIVKKSFFTFDYQLNYNTNNLISPINLHKPSFQYAYVLSQKSKIKLISSYQLLTQNEKSVQNTILDLIYTLKIPKQKTEIDITAQNITNQKYFSYFNQGLYEEVVSNFLLRPRQIFLTVKKQF